MKEAQKRDAVRQGTFYFRKDICKGITSSNLTNSVVDVQCMSCLLTIFSFPFVTHEGGNAVVDGCGTAQNGTGTDTEEYTLMSIDTIINGKVIASSIWNTFYSTLPETRLNVFYADSVLLHRKESFLV